MKVKTDAILQGGTEHFTNASQIWERPKNLSYNWCIAIRTHIQAHIIHFTPQQSHVKVHARSDDIQNSVQLPGGISLLAGYQVVRYISLLSGSLSATLSRDLLRYFEPIPNVSRVLSIGLQLYLVARHPPGLVIPAQPRTAFILIFRKSRSVISPLRCVNLEEYLGPALLPCSTAGVRSRARLQKIPLLLRLIPTLQNKNLHIGVSPENPGHNISTSRTLLPLQLPIFISPFTHFFLVLLILSSLLLITSCGTLTPKRTDTPVNEKYLA